LESVKISRSTISNTFLNLLFHSQKLKILHLNSFSLDDNLFKKLKNVPFQQIVELEISNSNFTTNKLITLFPQERESQIKTLKLNNNAEPDNPNKLENDELFLSNLQIDKSKSIDWDSPFFKNLELLEIKSKSNNINYVMNIAENPFFAKLKHFKGIEFDYKPIEKNKDKLERIFNTESKSRVSTYNFKSIALLNIFFNSNQSKIVDQIEVQGNDFTVELLDLIIKGKFIPNLKQVTLKRIFANQLELRDLVHNNPSIDFNIIKEIDEDESNMWPRIRVK
jgi:hypothetical protein